MEWSNIRWTRHRIQTYARRFKRSIPGYLLIFQWMVLGGSGGYCGISYTEKARTEGALDQRPQLFGNRPRRHLENRSSEVKGIEDHASK